jgi:fibronectin type 3 domain-containing protein
MSRVSAAIRIAVVLAAVVAPSATGLATPAGADLLDPATPVNLNATNTATTITLTWAQPATGRRPTHFRVYEGNTVVARNTTTRASMRNLAFGSTHTYRVTAVDATGAESPPSAPVTRSAMVGGPFACGITVPPHFTATEVTASAVSLKWSNAIPSYDQPGTIVLLEDSSVILQTTLDSARVGGLAPSSTHTYRVARRDCQGGLHASPPLTVTTAAGDPRRPTPPSAPTVGARTNSSIALSWTAAPAAAYAVYEGATRVTVTPATSVVLTGLWRDTAHEYRVAALDAAGNESAHSGHAAATTLPCDDPLPAPTGLTARAVSPSSVALSWVQISQVSSFTVYRTATNSEPATPVATVPGPSLMVTGLPSAGTARFVAVAETAGCGRSRPSAAATATTPAGPAARPAAPASLRLVSSVPRPGPGTGTVTLAWTQPAGDDPAVAYRLYEGTTVLATSQTTGVTLDLPGGPTHTVGVAAVDAAGNESAQSPLLAFTVPFIPPP